MSLAPGTRLNQYSVVEKIGEGGMGQVYRARDTKLDRDVAIKVLPEAFAHDAERLARFLREAKTLAALNHPNIAIIHGLEQVGDVHALVMELVEGDDLSQRIARGAIPIDEALPIAKQIAEALEAAHEQGIIHRDLKPANIKVRSDGTVKVLDFGLAKAMESPSAMSPSVSQAPTITTPAMMTGVGIILGTAAYMSPEQARGKVVDKRADIWAFGAVLFEMLTGQRAFGGDDVSEVLSRVLQREPEWAALPSGLSPMLLVFLRRCLQKDPKQRIGDIRDVRLALEGAFETAAPQAAVTATSSSKHGRLAWVAFAIASLAAATLAVPAVRYLREAPPDEPVLRLSVSLPSQPAFSVLSPDGRRLLLRLNLTGGLRLMVRSLDSSELQPLSGGDGSRGPFWSADGKAIGFFDQSDGTLKTMPAAGGPTQTLCAGTGLGGGGTWNREGVILFSGTSSDRASGVPITRVNAAGGACTAVTTPEGDSSHRYPAFLPDGRYFVYTVVGGDQAKRGVYVAAIDNPAARRLFADESSAIYAPSTTGKKYGYLLFLRTNALMAQPFSAETLELAGDAFPVGVELGTDVNGQVAASASAGGILVYDPSTSTSNSNQLTWLDRSGKALGTVGDFQRQQHVALAPDGKTAATLRNPDFAARAATLSLHDLQRGGETRVTSPPLAPSTPVWSPQSDRIAFGSGSSLYVKDASGGSPEERVLESRNVVMPSGWSQDGRYLIYTEVDPSGRGDIWYLPDPLSTSGERKPVKFQGTEAIETQGQLSPDGRWLAYVSDESGPFEIYVRPFPSGPGRWKVSNAGVRSLEPQWRRDGKELFFVENAFPSNRLMAVAVQSGPRSDFQAGEPQALFEFRTTGDAPPNTSQRYSPSADGQRFLVQVRPDAPAPTLSVITNWERAALARTPD